LASTIKVDYCADLEDFWRVNEKFPGWEITNAKLTKRCRDIFDRYNAEMRNSGARNVMDDAHTFSGTIASYGSIMKDFIETNDQREQARIAGPAPSQTVTSTSDHYSDGGGN
jgi:activator of HSP90 ATPase